MAGRITSITVQKRNKNRLNIEVNGSFAFGIDRLVGAWLQIGQYLSDEEMDALKQKDTNEVLYQAAIRLISYRFRSKAELAERLIGKGYSSSQVETVLDRLEQNDLINDRKFAESWVEDRLAFHPRSKRLMAMEMKHKGIPAEVISDTTAIVKDEKPLAYQAGEKALRRWLGVEESEFYKKCSAYLSRRGFTYSIIRAVLPDLWNELRDLKKY